MGSKFSNYVCDFYTSQYKYTEKEATLGEPVSTKVIMELIEPYLDTGSVLGSDNWYNSVNLVEKLLDRNSSYRNT